MEGYDGNGKLIASNGKSTSLLNYPSTPEEGFENILVLEALRATFYEELRNGTRLDKTKVTFKA